MCEGQALEPTPSTAVRSPSATSTSSAQDRGLLRARACIGAAVGGAGDRDRFRPLRGRLGLASVWPTTCRPHRRRDDARQARSCPPAAGHATAPVLYALERPEFSRPLELPPGDEANVPASANSSSALPREGPRLARSYAEAAAEPCSPGVVAPPPPPRSRAPPATRAGSASVTRAELSSRDGRERRPFGSAAFGPASRRRTGACRRPHEGARGAATPIQQDGRLPGRALAGCPRRAPDDRFVGRGFFARSTITLRFLTEDR
jgi:hypothetical protein